MSNRLPRTRSASLVLFSRLQMPKGKIPAAPPRTAHAVLLGTTLRGGRLRESPRTALHLQSSGEPILFAEASSEELHNRSPVELFPSLLLPVRQEPPSRVPLPGGDPLTPPAQDLVSHLSDTSSERFVSCYSSIWISKSIFDV